MTRIERFGLRTGFRGRTRRVFLVALLATALAKGAAFLPGYAIDDYRLVLRAVPDSSMLSQGRFGQAILVRLLDLLQLDPEHARVFFVAFAIFVSAAFGTLLARYWNLEKSWWLPAGVACLAANHPYTVEIFTFRTALGTAIWALAILSLLLVPPRWSRRHLLWGSLLFALALSIYQLALHFALMIVVAGAAIWLTRTLRLGSARGWPPRVRRLLTFRRLVRHRNTALLTCIVLGTSLYAVLGLISARVLEAQLTQRTALLSPTELDERAAMVLDVLELRLLGGSPLVPQATKWMLVSLLLITLAGLALHTRPLRPRPLLLATAVVALLMVALAWSLGVLWVIQEFWPTPRVLAHIGIFWAGALAVAYHASGRRARAVLALLTCLIVLSFVGSSNSALNDQVRLNTRDAHKANRILVRLETHPGFSAAASVVVTGINWGYPLGYTTMDHDMNISAFGATWAQIDVLRELSGYDLRQPTPAEVARAIAYCRTVEPWPGFRSVTVRDGLAIVCLGEN